MTVIKRCTAVYLALGLVMSIPAQAAEKTEAPCTLQDAQLVCAEGSRLRADIFEAFSSPETAAYIMALRMGDPVFEDGGKLERYRRSVERNWRAVTRHVRARLRDLRRRRISADEYEETRKGYVRARENYESAINLYREDYWYDRATERRKRGG